MVTDKTVAIVRMMADEPREHGEHERAQAIEALLEATRDEVIPTLDPLTSAKAGELLGVTGQTIKNWVSDSRLAGFRVGGRRPWPSTAAERDGRWRSTRLAMPRRQIW